MKIATLSIGDELLTGEIVDTNAAHIAGRLYDAGVRVARHLTVADDEEAIVAALKLQLLPEEKQAIESRGTASLEAYNLYLMARRYDVNARDADVTADPPFQLGLLRRGQGEFREAERQPVLLEVGRSQRQSKSQSESVHRIPPNRRS